MKTIIETPLRWGRSLVLGVLAAAALAAASLIWVLAEMPIWMLAQIGGPVPFSILWVVIVAPSLLLALVLVKARSTLPAVLCGFVFAIPVAAFCSILPSLDPNVRHYCGEEIWRDGVATIVLSVILMVCAAFLRRLGQSSLNDAHNSAESGRRED